MLIFIDNLSVTVNKSQFRHSNNFHDFIGFVFEKNKYSMYIIRKYVNF